MLTREDLLAIKEILSPRFDAIDKKFEGVTQRLDAHDKRFDRLELRVEHLESDISALRYGQLDLKKEIKTVYQKVEEAYDFALDNFGQIEESKTRLNILEGQY
ncbi:MAG: hypothetical protein J6C33_06490 [Lachnospiraceae bacterium]|nr:hypothetical protein [Lachnospiraceae bacterium]